MPRWLSLVERETCNLVVAGSIPVRGLYFYIYQNIYILLDYNIVMYSICGTIGQLGRSFGLWEPETPVRIRVVPFFIYTRLSSIWQSVGLQIQMLLVQVRQAGFYICFKFYFLDEISKTFIYYLLHTIVCCYDVSLHHVHCFCPGGVGAIMWACRARDSGSNPGQGA